MPWSSFMLLDLNIYPNNSTGSEKKNCLNLIRAKSVFHFGQQMSDDTGRELCTASSQLLHMDGLDLLTVFVVLCSIEHFSWCEREISCYFFFITVLNINIPSHSCLFKPPRELREMMKGLSLCCTLTFSLFNKGIIQGTRPSILQIMPGNIKNISNTSGTS